MSNEMMSSLLESSGRKPSLGRAITTFSTSFVLQAVVVSVLMLVPLMATDRLPMPEVVASRIVLPTDPSQAAEQSCFSQTPPNLKEHVCAHPRGSLCHPGRDT